MKIITPGHRYVLDGFEKPDENRQILQFIHKESDKSDPTKLVTLSDGTTNEEVISALIDRLKYLDEKFPCRENYLAIKGMQMALDSLEERTRNRLNRGVEGKNVK